MTASGAGFLLGDENVLKLIVGTVARRCEYTKSHWMPRGIRTGCVVCESYLNGTVS